MRFPIVLLGLLLLAAPVSAQRVGSYGKAPAAPAREPDFSELGVDQKLGEQVPLDLVFREDEHNEEITLGSCVGGKPTILVLAYYRCPMLCNLVLNGVLESVKGIEGNVGDRFNIVVVSFDPKDGFVVAHEKKKNFINDYGRANAGKGIRFLTGEPKAIDELCRSVGFRYVRDKQKKDQFDHPSCIMILTPFGKISQYFSGIQYDSQEVRAALEAAGGGKIGAEREPKAFLKFLCYEYDPVTGEYSFTVMKLLRVVFGTLVLVMGIWLFRAWRRPPNKAAPPPDLAETAANGKASSP
jgi:protein SCO1